MVGMLHERGVHFHLALEHRLEPGIHVVPGGNFRVPRRQLGVGGNQPELLLLREGDLALLVPAVGELALVLVDPFLRHMMRRVRGARREVHEERLVRQQRLLLARPGDELVGQIFGEVVALGRRLRRLDRRGALIQRRIPLIVLAADEAVEVLEPSAPGRPRIERTCRARLPDGNFVALAELRGRVAVEFERERQRCFGIGQHRTLARRSGSDLGDSAHADRVMVAPREQRLPCRRTQRRRVEARVLQAVLRQLREVRRVARAAEHAGRTIADVVDKDHEHVGRALRRPHVPNRRKLRVRVFCVVGDQALFLDVGNRQLRPGHGIIAAHANLLTEVVVL